MLEISYFKAAFTASSVPMLVIDAQTSELTIIDANTVYASVCNATNIIGNSFTNWVQNVLPINNDDKILLAKSLQQTIETGKVHDVIITNYFQGLSSANYTVREQPVTNDNGVVLFIIHTVTTNNRQLPIPNLFQEQEYMLLETISDGFLTLANDFTVLYSNRQLEKIWNIERNEIVGKNLWDHFDKNQFAHIYQFYTDAMTSTTAKCIETFSEQLQLWYEVTTYPFKAGLSVYFKDITERKVAFEKEALLASIIETSDDGIISKTLDGIITSWNKGAETIFGYTAEEAIGQHISLIIPKELFPAEEPSIIMLVKNGQRITNYETARVSKSGQYISVSLTVSPIKNVKGSIIGASKIIRNITEKKQAEILLRQKNLELIQSAKQLEKVNTNLEKKAKALAASNTELEQFAYVASHDLQEPLRMVTSFLTQLNNKYEDVLDDKAKKYIAFAVDGARRMRQIILDLLEFSRVGRVENSLELVNTMALIDRITMLFLKEIEETKATIIYNHLPTVTYYPVPLHQVFQNLIGNALKYRHPQQAPIINIKATDIGNYWQFEVADNGIGIESEYFEKIFVIFQRLHSKEAYSGTGMGLAITKKIIENLGGKIWLTSTENKGSTFYFTIPK